LGRKSPLPGICGGQCSVVRSVHPGTGEFGDSSHRCSVHCRYSKYSECDNGSRPGMGHERLPPEETGSLAGDQARYPGTSWVIWRTSSRLCPGAARARLRTKWFAVLVRPKDVRLFPLMRRSHYLGTAGPAAAGMISRPCCGRHRCWVRGSRRPGGGARRCAARAGYCPAGTMVPGPEVQWSCPAVLVPLMTARVLRRGLR
jgi:hypothetical protein